MGHRSDSNQPGRQGLARWRRLCWPLTGALLLSLACGDSEPGPNQTPDDPYAQLAEIETDGSSARVGLEGGRIDFGDVTLEVPRGALETEVSISSNEAEIPESFSIFGEPISPIIEMRPEGQEFALPIKLRLQLDEAPADREGLDALFVVSTARAEGEVDDLALIRDESDSSSVKVWVSHFSRFGAFPMPEADTGPTVDDIVARGGGSTAPVGPLSLQILTVMRSDEGVAMSALPVAHSLLVTSAAGDPLDPPQSQTGLVRSLETALSAGAAQGARPLFLNSAWRSVAQQYVLRNGGNPFATASAGQSQHQNGAAIDLGVIGLGSRRDACTANQELSPAELRDAVFPVWGDLLEEDPGDFIWYETVNPGNRCGDPVHFTHEASRSRDLRPQSVRAFQKLWNRRNPCAPVEVIDVGAGLGVNLDQTWSALGRSPAGGFDGLEALGLPAAGAGCSESGALCCPGRGPTEAPYCAQACDSPDAGTDGGPGDGTLMDGEMDAGLDDAGLDGGMDAGLDAGMDGAVDAGLDAGPGSLVIDRIAPPTGVPGSRAVILGSGFGASQGASAVTIGGVTSTITYAWSDTRVEVNIPTTLTGTLTNVSLRVGATTTPAVSYGVAESSNAGVTFFEAGCRVHGLVRQRQMNLPVLIASDIGGIAFSSDGTQLYLVLHPFYLEAQIWSMTVLRDPSDQGIVGFANPVMRLEEPYVDGGLEVGPSGHVFFTQFDEGLVGYLPNPAGGGMSSLTFPLDAAVRDPTGIHFDAARLGPNTCLVAGYGNGVIASLDWTASSTTYTPSPTATVLLDSTTSPEGIHLVPSGVHDGDLLLSDWFADAILRFDWPPATTADAPAMFATGIDGAYGMDFDPITGDLFVVGTEPVVFESAFYQIRGCP